MKSILCLGAVCLFLAANVRGEPRIASWYTAGAGTYARVYLTTNDLANGTTYTTWTRGSVTQALPAYVGIQGVYSSSNATYIRTSGLGAHPMGPWYLNAAKTTLFPNLPKNQAALWRIPATISNVASHTLTGLGAIGLFVDGVSMFDSRDGYVWTGSAEAGNGTGYWNRDAYVNEGVTFDPGNAHQEQTGTYHYHANPPALRHALGDHVDYNAAARTYAESTNAPTQHSPILGWVRDGSPIYGPYGFADATNPASGIARMRSGYQLRNGTNGTDNLTATGRSYIPAWAVRAYVVASNQTGPTVNATYPLGRYMEDNAYLGDLGYTQGVHFDLDEYNGRWCVTPDFTNGVYAYFVSIASNGAPAFPYNIGRTFHAAPSGSTVASITESVATNYVGGADEKPAAALRPGATLTLTWSAVEGGTYRVESSSDLSAWSPVATNVAAATNIGTLVVSNSSLAVYRVTRVAVSNYDGSGTTTGGGGTGILSMVPNAGNRGTAVPFTINLDAGAPPTNAPVFSLTIGTNVITGATHPTATTVAGTFTIGAGAATGAQDVILIWPGPPGNPTARVTNALPAGFTIN